VSPSSPLLLSWRWLISGFNFFSHGSQDLYPVYLQTTKKFSSFDASKATIISNVGAIIGTSSFFYQQLIADNQVVRLQDTFPSMPVDVWRKFHPLIPADDRIIICLCYTACWIPLWILPSSFGGLAAGGFFIQSGVQGAWGVVPIYLGESSIPPATRTY
jgi:SHS family lactate transporter-like MFS transporter